MFINFFGIFLPSWASEKQPIKVLFRHTTSNPIQKQRSRKKNYPRVFFLEASNRFSLSRKKGVQEMPTHVATRAHVTVSKSWVLPTNVVMSLCSDILPQEEQELCGQVLLSC